MKQLLLVGLLFSSVASASVEITVGDYKNRDDVNAFVSRIEQTSDYTAEALVGLFSQVKKQSHLFEKLNKPAEKALQWHQYRRIFIKDKRIDLGVTFWQEHLDLLSKVSADTGVPAEIIVAIIGVETFYGNYTGKDPVFDSLVTVAFDYPQRAKFFTRELEQFLLLVKEQNFEPLALKGSYAGAMGMPQFIASSYREYAVDGDGDGQVNLFDNMADITASIANYFVVHGWRANEAVAKLLIVAEKSSIDELKPSVKTDYQWSDLKRHGLVSEFKLADKTPVALVKLEQKNHSEYWAGLNNFYVITRYNHNEMYAMAVYQLSVLIKAKMAAAE